jgi:hypothetical protein
MALDRDGILNALRDRLAGAIQGLGTCTRRDIGFDEIKMPGLILRTESMERDDLGRWVIRARINALDVVREREDSPETRLNELIDQVDDAFDARPDELPSDGFRTTLGGLCSACRISGRIEMVQGSNGGIGEVSIPVEIIAYEAD